MVDLEKIKAELFEKGSQLTGWRIKRHQISGVTRYVILEALVKAKEPLTDYQLAYILGKSLQSTRDHLQVLRYNNIICNKLTTFQTEQNVRKQFFTVCPVCPMLEDCNDKLDFWKGQLKEGE